MASHQPIVDYFPTTASQMFYHAAQQYPKRDRDDKQDARHESEKKMLPKARNLFSCATT